MDGATNRTLSGYDLPRHAGAGSLYSKEYYELVRKALAPGGLAVLTTHGRTHDERQTSMHYVDAEKWAPAREQYRATGFGFAPYPTAQYGVSVCSAAWLAAFVATLPEVRLVMFREAAWDNHQDVIVIQRA